MFFEIKLIYSKIQKGEGGRQCRASALGAVGPSSLRKFAWVYSDPGGG